MSERVRGKEIRITHKMNAADDDRKRKKSERDIAMRKSIAFIYGKQMFLNLFKNASICSHRK